MKKLLKIIWKWLTADVQDERNARIRYEQASKASRKQNELIRL